MNFKQYAIPFLSIVFLLLGIIIEYTSFLSPQAEQYRYDIEENLHAQETHIYQLAEQKEYFERIIRNEYTNSSIQHADLDWLEKLSKSGFTCQVYQGDSLVFWSNNHINFDKKENLDLQETPSLVNLKDGSYELIKYPLELNTLAEYQLYGFISIKNKYNLDSKYLQPKFVANPYIPKELILTKEKPSKTEVTALDIKTKNGKILGYVSATGPLADVRVAYFKFFAYLFGFIFLGILINRYAKQFVQTKSLVIGAGFLIGSLVGLRLLSAITDFSGRFAGMALFNKTPEVFVFGNSLGDFIINIILLFWVILFVHRQFQIPFYGHMSYSKRFGLVLLNAFGVVFAIANVASMLKQLIFHSNIAFNFDNVFNLQSNSLFAIGGVILLLISLFLISHLLMMIIKQTNLDLRDRFTAYGLMVLTFIPLSLYYDLNLISIKMFLFLIVFIGLFDIFIEHETNNLTWLVTWLVILSGLSSSLLYSYNQEQDAINRIWYAQNLVESKDTLAEARILHLEQKLLKESVVQKFRMGNEVIPNKEFYEALDYCYSNNSYLYNNYKYNSLFLDPDHVHLNSSEQFDLANATDFSIVANTDEQSELYLANKNQIDDSYYLKIPYHPNGVESEAPHWWMLEFFHKERKQSRVYSELLKEQAYKGLNGLKNYDYAIYKGANRVNYTSSSFSNPLDYNNLVVPNEGMIVDTTAEGILTSTFLKNNRFVILQKSVGGYIKPVSLFSFVFALLIFFVLIMSLINNFMDFFPKTLSFSVIRKPSLRGKIQLYVISLIVTSFILIGVVTIVYFSNSHEEYHENRLVRKTESVIKNTEHELESLLARLPQDVPFSNKDLRKLNLEAISNIHRMDVNLYDQSGELVQSSEMDIFQKGVVSPQMNALAYQRLARIKSNTPIQDVEKIGSLDYKSAYIPLRIAMNGEEQTLGYLGLPYYSKQSKLREDVTVFMGTLLNVYVFLLIIAGAIAILVANSITKPIAVIGEKLKGFKIGGQNEPLEWHSHDELGALIEEYNRMVLKVKEGADVLAQSEREGAWREMAKQVAHEIKNPLTPMKLSIQYLLHAYRSNPNDIEPLLKRVSNTLIEQIDNLSQIASEFSNFAKMPRAENQRIVLNNLVGSVYDLFKEHRDKGLELDLPPEEYYVYADKNHLIRVFNNLIKNAIQAIPDDRKGHILVKMYTERGKILVEVKDNGTGISDEMKEKVFVPNFTTKNSGTGLGLAISKNIIESVSGEIYFKTKVGKGTSFFVKLPIIDVKQPEEVQVSI